MVFRPVVNEFIRKGAESFPKVPYEELYDLQNDPYQQNNLIKKLELKAVKEKLSGVLKVWMTEQNDLLISHKMPLIKPTLHPLDRLSKWNIVDAHLLGQLTESDYVPVHY